MFYAISKGHADDPKSFVLAVFERETDCNAWMWRHGAFGVTADSAQLWAKGVKIIDTNGTHGCFYLHGVTA